VKNRRLTLQAHLSKKLDPTSKITGAKTVGSVVQVIEHLPCKRGALSSKPGITKKIVSRSSGIY
jgi:hypothetical protein